MITMFHNCSSSIIFSLKWEKMMEEEKYDCFRVGGGSLALSNSHRYRGIDYRRTDKKITVVYK